MEQPQEASGPASRGIRADAARNRASILAAATEILAEHGGAVDVREIARRSGVGMGTLYRHFPTKDELLNTVLREEFVALADCATAEATCADPWQALTGFFERALQYQAGHRAAAECLAGTWSHPAAPCSAQLRPAIDRLLARAHAAGAVRRGVTGDDLALMLASLGQCVQMTERCRPGMWRRQLSICLDGLRPEHVEPLPSATPDEPSGE